jgi:F-type H+-transporting ATPase subunit b
MTVLASILPAVGRFVAAEGHEYGIDADGHITSQYALWPDKAELIYGTIASLIIFFLLYKYAGPQIAKAMKARTAKVQKELDDSAADKASATAEAAQIRQAKGDIAAERARIMAEAAAQAESVLTDGRARIDHEITDLEAKSVADISAARNRVGDELRAEIARLSVAAVDQVVTGSLDNATHQRLIEDFISRVGATSPAGSGAPS